jgi:hypothetical protein
MRSRVKNQISRAMVDAFCAGVPRATCQSECLPKSRFSGLLQLQPMDSSSLVTLKDAALPSALFSRLRRAVDRVGEQRLRATYQTTFWYPLGEEPKMIVEQCAQEVRRHLPPLPDIIGVEWWLSRMRTTDVRVDFHQDRDEKLALERGKLVHPRVSSVLFLNAVRGGLLAVTSEAPNEDNPSFAPDLHDFALVRPVPNRFVFFEGSLTHGVLDANNAIPHGKPTAKGQMRKTLIFNWWHRRPLDVPQFEERRVYHALRDPVRE